jgi:hypothetical protein
VSREAGKYPDRITLSDTAEHYLSRLADDLALGNVELSQLPPALMALWTFAYESGRQSLAPALDRAQSDADRYYVRWANPGVKLQEWQRARLDLAAEEYWQQFLSADTPQLHTDQKEAA